MNTHTKQWNSFNAITLMLTLMLQLTPILSNLNLKRLYLHVCVQCWCFSPAGCSYHSSSETLQTCSLHRAWRWPHQWVGWALHRVELVRSLFKWRNTPQIIRIQTPDVWGLKVMKGLKSFVPLESNFLNFCVARSCWSASSEKIIWIMSGVITASCRRQKTPPQRHLWLNLQSFTSTNKTPSHTSLLMLTSSWLL